LYITRITWVNASYAREKFLFHIAVLTVVKLFVTIIDFQKNTSAQDYLKDPGTPIKKYEHPKLNIENLG